MNMLTLAEGIFSTRLENKYQIDGLVLPVTWTVITQLLLIGLCGSGRGSACSNKTKERQQFSNQLQRKGPQAALQNKASSAAVLFTCI